MKGEREREAALAKEDKYLQVPPSKIPPPAHPRLLPVFLSGFFTPSGVCLFVVCVRRSISMSSVRVFLVSPVEVLAFDRSCTAT